MATLEGYGPRNTTAIDRNSSIIYDSHNNGTRSSSATLAAAVEVAGAYLMLTRTTALDMLFSVFLLFIYKVA
jgi:hypothetical protein